MINKLKKAKIVLILTGISFFASGIDNFDNNLLISGISSMIVAGINMIAVFFVFRKSFLVNMILIAVNALFGLFLFIINKSDIRYRWLLVAVVYIIAGIIAFKKQNVSKSA